MKKLIISVCCLFFMTGAVQAQETNFFSLTPLGKNTTKVNGVTLGAGYLPIHENDYKVVNGLNIDLMVLSPLFVLIGDPSIYRMETPTNLSSNGVSLAIGGFYKGTVHNGFSISAFNLCNGLHGVSVVATYNSSNRMDGFHIGGAGNFAEHATGMFVGFSNKTDFTKGIHIGVLNYSKRMTGLQIGLYNQTDALKGLQVGLWNKNNKRSLPLVNF